MIRNLDPEQERKIRRRKAREMTASAVENISPLDFLAAAELWEQVGEYETARTCVVMSEIIALVENDQRVKTIIPDE